MEQALLNEGESKVKSLVSRGRYPGNSLTPPPPKGGEGVRETHSPEPVHSRQEQAARVRAAFPTCTAFADTLRAVFPEARLLYASEGGQSIGTKGPDGVPVVLESKTGKPITDADLIGKRGKR